VIAPVARATLGSWLSTGKFFGGLEIEEIAQALEVSAATVKRDWTLARAWLRRELGGVALG
jgi:DNA-directed RNA polymerase specialized sigma24 family protein